MTSVGFMTLLRRESIRFFKLPVNTIVPSIISITLYLLVFGFSLGNRIQEVGGLPYIQFIIPGLVLMNIITGSYSNPSGSLFFTRWIKSIDEILVSPISYLEMTLAYILGGMMRGLTLGLITYLITIIFSPVMPANFLIALFFMLAASFLFSCVGVLVGLWAKSWEGLNIFLTFFLTPLTFLGGVFYSIDMLPSALQIFTKFNPIFYMINGFRYGLVGVADGSVWIGAGILLGLSTIMFVIIIQLFKNGWNLRS